MIGKLEPSNEPMKMHNELHKCATSSEVEFGILEWFHSSLTTEPQNKSGSITSYGSTIGTNKVYVNLQQHWDCHPTCKLGNTMEQLTKDNPSFSRTH